MFYHNNTDILPEFTPFSNPITYFEDKVEPFILKQYSHIIISKNSLLFFEADNSFSSKIDKNKIEEYTNYENPYLLNWKIHDVVTGLPKSIERSYFVFPDETDIFYEGGKTINSGHPKLNETPVYIAPVTLAEIEE